MVFLIGGKRDWESAEKIFGAGVFLYAFCLAYYRLQFGVDFTDEAYYAVLTQRFALGDRPFVDEFNLRQTAAVLLVPSYWLYLKIVGSTDGIILFLRHHYFFLQCLTGWGVFRLLRIHTRLSYALIGAAIPLAFIPLGVPAAGYNNLGALFWALGICLALTGVLAPDHRRDLMIAGAVHALACVAYPPLVIAVAGIMVALFTSVRSPQVVRIYGGGFAAVSLVFVIILGPGFFQGFEQALDHERVIAGPRGLEKFAKISTSLIRRFATDPLLSLALIGAVGGSVFGPVRRNIIPIAIVIVVTIFSNIPRGYITWAPVHGFSLHMSTCLGLITGAALFFGRPWKTARTVFYCGFAPTFLAAVIIAMASGNGSISAGIGFLTAAAILPLAAALKGETGSALSLRQVPLILALALIPLAMTRLNYEATYPDDRNVAHQTTRVSTGPYKGMFASRHKALLAEALTKELRLFVRPRDRMLAYYSIPAAYLSVPALPAVQVSWLDRGAIITQLLPYYDSRRTGAGIAVVLAGEGGTSDELERLIEVPERLIKDLGTFRIYREPPGTGK